jgi:hypothetical protein
MLHLKAGDTPFRWSPPLRQVPGLIAWLPMSAT